MVIVFMRDRLCFDVLVYLYFKLCLLNLIARVQNVGKCTCSLSQGGTSRSMLISCVCFKHNTMRTTAVALDTKYPLQSFGTDLHTDMMVLNFTVVTGPAHLHSPSEDQ